MARAGVTLNDTPETINKKLAEDAYNQEKITAANEMATNGYTAMTADQAALKPSSEVVVITDAKGNKSYYWKKAETTSSAPTVIGSASEGYMQWDPTTGQFVPISGTGTTDDKIIKAFKNDLADVKAVKASGSREQFVRLMELKYPELDPSSIREYVFGTYPDNSISFE
jgi:23S rRNA U2552 (ribose-2'-O)-methylase RlmE/FtsJ